MENHTLDVRLAGKEYRVACKPEDRDSLLEAVSYLDGKLREATAKTGASGDKLTIMTALNVAHEFLQYQRSGGFDMPGLKRRIELMNTRLDGVLAQQEKLF